MADSPKKPKVGVYEDASAGETTGVDGTTGTTTRTETTAEAKGGFPTWTIALVIAVLVILALIYFL